ncbi:hypothetical protein N836_13610 [Leptolyngbya sp. Heron Island J]|uniref:hypothetical protein n=1 Tax=Leptolyngbya sp. Heron Island J TaxID=1385935 RepID=UPI0003B97D24|nr:hypothetical protein [Leptolyngbya sp. Heron Island J]ESA35097.1 hypothetical protein N836_13610 [Leptolyngbya sp. Heron Island J]
MTQILQSVGTAITRKPLISIWLAAVGVSATLSLTGNPIATRIGDCGLVGLLAAATTEQISKRKNAAALKAAQVDKTQFESEQRQLEQQLEALSKSQKELDQAETKLITFQGQLKADKKALDLREQTYKDRILIEQTRIADSKAEKAVASMQAKLEAALADKAAVQSEYTIKMGQVTDTAKKAVAIKEEHNKKLTAAAEKAIDTRDQVLADERGQVNGVLERLSREINAMAQELAAQKEMVAKLQAPKTFQFNTYEAQVANKIQAFLNGRGVVLSCQSIGTVHYGRTPIFYEAINCDLKTVTDQLEAVQLHLGLTDLPIAEIENGFIKITVQLSQDKSGRAADKAIAIVNPPLSRLESALDASIHIRIAAPSNSGKSVTLGNLINYLARDYPNGYEASDPKVTEPENWGDIEPQHLGAECLEHLFNLIPAIMYRVNKVKDAIRSKTALPKFDPQFHVFDELELLYGLAEVSENKKYTPKAFKNNVKLMLKAGREHKLKLLCVTQSPLPSDINLRKNDFFNTSSLLLGNCISEALNNRDDGALLEDVPSELKAKLKAEYKARLAEVNKLKKGKPDDYRVPQEFIYLFFNPAKPHDVFMGLCPPPGHYSSAKSKTELPQNREASTAQPRTGSTSGTQLDQAVATGTAESATTANSTTGALTVDLSALLEAGTHCPQCGTHTASYAKRKPNGLGNVFPKCKNTECETKTFKWNPTARAK